jgi:Methyltransferase domain
VIRAASALELLAAGERFDLVFVDGSHHGLDVLVDAALSWQLLRDGGFLVFDDYVWRELGEDALLRPGVAIDAFLTLVDAKYELLFADDQVGLRKVAYPTSGS